MFLSQKWLWSHWCPWPHESHIWSHDLRLKLLFLSNQIRLDRLFLDNQASTNHDLILKKWFKLKRDKVTTTTVKQENLWFKNFIDFVW